MTVLEALLGLRAPATSRAAYAALAGYVRAYVGGRWRLRGAALDDAVAETVFKVLRAMELGRFEPDVEGVARKYVLRVAHNHTLDVHRRRAREVLSCFANEDEFSDLERGNSPDDSAAVGAAVLNRVPQAPGHDGLSDGVNGDDLDSMTAQMRVSATALLSELAKYAIERRRKQDRESLERAFEQLLAIRFGGATVDQFIDDAHSHALSGAESKRERDRHYKAHERCRFALAEALELMAADGHLGAEREQLARACVQYF